MHPCLLMFNQYVSVRERVVLYLYNKLSIIVSSHIMFITCCLVCRLYVTMRVCLYVFLKDCYDVCLMCLCVFVFRVCLVWVIRVCVCYITCVLLSGVFCVVLGFVHILCCDYDITLQYRVCN